MWEELAGCKGMRAQEVVSGREKPARGRSFVVEQGKKMQVII